MFLAKKDDKQRPMLTESVAAMVKILLPEVRVQFLIQNHWESVRESDSLSEWPQQLGNVDVVLIVLRVIMNTGKILSISLF